MSGALTGVKVLDLTRVLAGPFCTMMLGDLGADVIKVEAPGGSDDTRGWGPPYTGGESAYYLCTNRNKRGITLNLKSEEGRAIVKKMAATSDVLIQNFKVGTMEKWGLGYEDLKKINSGLVYCSISGFGHEGPYQHLPGYDYIVQAMGGMMSITGSEETGPMKVGVAIADLATGMFAAISILAALHERTKSGEGQHVDISLFDSQIAILANVASNYLISGNIPKRYGNQHPNIVPYQVFKAKDGEMVIAVGNDRQFEKLCQLMNREELSKDPRFSTNSSRLENRETIIPILQEELMKKGVKEWQVLLNEAGIPNGPINNMEQIFQDPQVEARQMKITMPHPTAEMVSLVGSPLKLSRTSVEYLRHPPLAGEHTEEVLQEFGFLKEEINQFRKNGII
ncbi:CoA transferase [Microaerobacter geothermalis]|uniref:CaiB/BaiF CoA transferase family protein n=1 Tax=Microaerobacter geothermalis TaxID=674972 RepID=UPI001F25CA53|nr:CaiB/BaiF CoA-transferase family protein [Microaerobacter geothermalis]MCF6094948.1 CoA transferase [Microaerobacter geothermalis]